ncbi:hypothetical protein [Photobacterium nomapromontoriensis]|uniref:hypothetical protein n=1 Tax=Photobacterium nomapromontoriensis TaxID=2910237 RepID=UPI003D12721A
MDLFDSWGESLGGIWDSALNGGEQWVESWFDNEADKVTSAAPEENRVPQNQEPAKQPDGQPIYSGGLTTHTALMIGGGVIVAVLAVAVLMRGK